MSALLRIREYDVAMKIATGRVVAGKVAVDGMNLPEGTTVTVLSDELDDQVVLTPEEEDHLLEALAEADRGETISVEQLFARLDRLKKH